MDKRSWPWKKKSYGKVNTAANSSGNQGDQENTKDVNYVEISAESYAHLIELEDQVKILNEKLSSAQSEMTNKCNLAKQHGKVAEEAVSGWEKAEAEALALKQQLESVTLQKLMAEDRASQFDGALKECMKQIGNLKKENEQKMQDTIFTKTQQWERVKSVLEAKIVNFEQELTRSSTENASLSRSLQEHSTQLMKISEEKSQADAMVEILKANIQSCEREINSLKYELHVISKELEIRNEEKNMSIRSTEAANKQHIEDVRKITKLEADCQRLRGLVRKKLPGTAALAQMRLEVENLGRDYSENRLHQSNEFLTARLLSMEEETKMLREALFMSKNELQASMNMYAETLNKLRSVETHKVLNQQRSPIKPDIDQSLEGSWSQDKGKPKSEDGIDEEGSCSESWATSLVLELSQFQREKVENTKKAENSNQLELMDDFLEMERLACLSTETNRTAVVSDGVIGKPNIEISDGTPSIDVPMDVGKEHIDFKHHIDGLSNAISAIQDFVLWLCKESIDDGLREKLEEFSGFIEIPHKEINLDDYIIVLSHILSKTKKISFDMWSGRVDEGEITSIDCIDKVTLLENKVVQHEAGKEMFEQRPTIPGCELKAGSFEEFEQMKLEKDNLQIDLARCNESLEYTKLRLVKMEENLEELKSELTSCQKSNSLAETQLRCMTESYKSMEQVKKELEAEINHLRSKVEALDHELQEERHSHQEDLERYKDLQEKIERNVTCSICSLHSEAGVVKTKQEREFAAATEKLAECQETILLLSRQLKALHPPTGPSSEDEAHPSTNDLPPRGAHNPNQSTLAEQNAAAGNSRRIAGESPLVGYNSNSNLSNFEASPAPSPPASSKRQKHRSRSASSSSLASMLGEKQGRSLSRFFFQMKE